MISRREDGGVVLTFAQNSKIEHLKVCLCEGIIELSVSGEFHIVRDNKIYQYLTPSDAMTLSKALKALAFSALEDGA